jgi:small multidrug resistance family-3 protein
MLMTILLFLAAGLAEIGGGYLIWLWLREAKPVGYGVAGALILIGVRHSPDVSILPFLRPCIRRLWRGVHRTSCLLGVACRSENSRSV